jgi:hypothetical protein
LATVVFREITEHQSLNLRMPNRPTVLPELTTTATTPCALIERADPVVGTLWDEASKGLIARVLSTDLALPGFRLIAYRRRLSGSLVILAEDSDTTPSHRSTRPFLAMAPAQLIASGFVQGAGPQFTFFGPDEALILSDAFLATHCFVAVERRDGMARQKGLQFRPVPGRRMPDITGTLWLSAAAAELATIEFTFVNVPAGVLTDGLGGRIDFERHPSGISFVRRWYIRVPFPLRQAADDARLGRLRTAPLGGFTEDGGVAELLPQPS